MTGLHGLPQGLAHVVLAVTFAIPVLSARLDAADADWRTRAERSGFQETARYEETVAFCRRLAEASPWVRYTSFGTSPEGRDLPLLILSRSGVFDPRRAREADLPVVLVQNCIHAGECAGKDASLMLARDIAITRLEERLIDNLVLLIIPIFNVDGHERFGPYNRINQNGPREMGWRVTARNLNLNRDYTKADTPEMRAWLRLWVAWRPHLFIDTHTTNGANHRFSLMYDASYHEDAHPAVAAWLRDTLLPQVVEGLAAQGHPVAPFFSLIDRTDPAKGVRTIWQTPRLSTGYGNLHNRPSILIEAHMLRPYLTRVWGTYYFLRYALRAVSQDPGPLLEACRRADADAAALGRSFDPHRQVPLLLEPTDDDPVGFVFLGFRQRLEPSEISGAQRLIYLPEPVDVETKMYTRRRPAVTVTPPLGYLIPRPWDDVARLLALHGLRVERTLEPVSGQFDTYRFRDVRWPQHPYQGRFMPTFAVEPLREPRTFPAGSFVVWLDQPAARVAVHLLEPQAPDSLVRWGFFNAIFERREYAEDYILEDLARRMLEQDPALREEFHRRLDSDPKFAGDPRARLEFFYRRSPYYDSRVNIYPVVRLTERRDWKTMPLPPASEAPNDSRGDQRP